mmetsp:Transcript_12921/g.39878  ORF Transcript_12921/g.39878 Transcript_12921/m.39878 type:complete len:131 (+) Transcript_12921:203-595(+)
MSPGDFDLQILLKDVLFYKPLGPQLRAKPPDVRAEHSGVDCLWVGRNKHDCGTSGQILEESGDAWVLHNHTFEMSLHLSATQLELLDYIRNLLKAMDVAVRRADGVCYHKECCAFKKNYLVSPAHIAEYI